MQLTYGELLSAYEPLRALVGKKFPVVVSLALAKLAKNLAPETEIVKRLHEQLYNTYGERDPKDPRKVIISPAGENFPKFAEELGQLLEQTCEIGFEIVKLPGTEMVVCNKCRNIIATALEIEPATLMLLEKFIEVG